MKFFPKNYYICAGKIHNSYNNEKIYFNILCNNALCNGFCPKRGNKD